MTKISSKINKNIKIGIVGSGKISEEYIRVIKFFNHKVIKIVTKTKSKKNIIFCKKNKIKHHYLSFNKAINSDPKVDAWIICSSWNTLKKNLSIAIKNNISLLIEKSIIITSKDLEKLKSKLKPNQLNRMSIAYNRNYYDFIPYLIKEIKKESLEAIYAYLPESYQSIIDKKGIKIKNHLTKYMTSHWITLIYNVLKNSNAKINLSKKFNYSNKNILSSNLVVFDVNIKDKKIPLIINILPNNPMNINISFYSKKKTFVLSPVEKLKVYKKIRIIKKNIQNVYIPMSKNLDVNKTFKPGIKLMYRDFINSCVLKNKKSNYMTKLNDLIEIYKICETIQK